MPKILILPPSQFQVGYCYDGCPGAITCEIPDGDEKVVENEPVTDADEGDTIYRVKLRVKSISAGSECKDSVAYSLGSTPTGSPR